MAKHHPRDDVNTSLAIVLNLSILPPTSPPSGRLVWLTPDLALTRWLVDRFESQPAGWATPLACSPGELTLSFHKYERKTNRFCVCFIMDRRLIIEDTLPEMCDESPGDPKPGESPVRPLRAGAT
jgi:hypothetical protein